VGKSVSLNELQPPSDLKYRMARRYVRGVYVVQESPYFQFNSRKIGGEYVRCPSLCGYVSSLLKE